MKKDLISISTQKTQYYGWLNLETMLIYREKECYVEKKPTWKTLSQIHSYDMPITKEDIIAIWNSYADNFPNEYRRYSR